MKPIRLSQWSAMSTLLILGPALRLLPQRAAAEAGRSCWLAVLPMLPLLLVYMMLLSRLWAQQPEGTGMAELTLLKLGPRLGRPALCLFAAWFLFYGGFLLRAGADRLVVTVYPHASPKVFTLSMGLLCLLAALGPLRSLSRAAKLILPLLLTVLLTLLLLSLKDVQASNLLPVTILDLPAMLRAGISLLDVLALGIFLPLFLLPQVEHSSALWPRTLRRLLAQALLLTLLTFTVVGKFGAEIVAQLTHPFFTLVRNLVLFQSLERIEALVVSCWIFPDFILVSLCFYTAQYCLRLSFGSLPLPDDGPRYSMTRMRWFIPLCSLSSVLVGLLLAPDLTRLRRLSEYWIPAVNLTLCFFSPLLLFAADKLRGRSWRLLPRALPRKRRAR